MRIFLGQYSLVVQCLQVLGYSDFSVHTEVPDSCTGKWHLHVNGISLAKKPVNLIGRLGRLDSVYSFENNFQTFLIVH